MPDEENIIIAPADGKIIDVQHNQDLLSYDKKFIELSIYLSLWDVHINRIPVSGTVFYMKYQKGRFHPAFTKEASLKNESNLIGIKTKFGDVFVKQIAGKIVRRIVCNISRGDTVVIGQKFGMIKFGSRVELFLPQNVDLLIKEGSLVKGSESIIGTFNEK